MVRTSRRGRDNPGSTPGEDIFSDTEVGVVFCRVDAVFADFNLATPILPGFEPGTSGVTPKWKETNAFAIELQDHARRSTSSKRRGDEKGKSRSRLKAPRAENRWYPTATTARVRETRQAQGIHRTAVRVGRALQPHFLGSARASKEKGRNDPDMPRRKARTERAGSGQARSDQARPVARPSQAQPGRATPCQSRPGQA